MNKGIVIEKEIQTNKRFPQEKINLVDSNLDIISVLNPQKQTTISIPTITEITAHLERISTDLPNCIKKAN